MGPYGRERDAIRASFAGELGLEPDEWVGSAPFFTVGRLAEWVGASAQDVEACAPEVHDLPACSLRDVSWRRVVAGTHLAVTLTTLARLVNTPAAREAARRVSGMAARYARTAGMSRMQQAVLLATLQWQWDDELRREGLRADRRAS